MRASEPRCPQAPPPLRCVSLRHSPARFGLCPDEQNDTAYLPLWRLLSFSVVFLKIYRVDGVAGVGSFLLLKSRGCGPQPAAKPSPWPFWYGPRVMNGS